jgi:serine protease inhibitor
MKMSKTVLLFCCLIIGGMTLLNACIVARVGEPTLSPEPAAVPDVRSNVSRETALDIAPATVDDLVAGNNRFACDLFQAVAQEEGNLLFSPYSISAALAMTYAGARSETAVQMADTLYYTLPQSQLHPAFNALNLQLTASDDQEEFALVIANRIWGQIDMEFRQEFLDLLAAHYGAGMHLAFSDSEAGFSGTAEIPPTLYFSQVLPKAYVAVDELGTEAAAATAVEVAVGSEEVTPETMRVDRPFLFLIRDTEQGTILFLGRVVDPATLDKDG